MSGAPYGMKSFRAICTREDAKTAGVPLASFYAWKNGQRQLPIHHWLALIAAKDLYVRLHTRQQIERMDADRRG